MNLNYILKQGSKILRQNMFFNSKRNTHLKFRKYILNSSSIEIWSGIKAFTQKTAASGYSLILYDLFVDNMRENSLIFSCW